MATATATEEREMVVAPFGIEADAHRNADILLQCLPGVKLRSRIDGARTVKDRRTGDEMIPRDQANLLTSFPKAPGMQLHVDPARLTYMIIDPLHDDKDMCERIGRWLKNNSPVYSPDMEIKGVERQEGTLDKHRMKSLVREMLWLIESEDAKLAKGPLPTMEEVETLPGRFLLNPGSRVQNTQPMYEDDWDKWVDQLTRSGG